MYCWSGVFQVEGERCFFFLKVVVLAEVVDWKREWGGGGVELGGGIGGLLVRRNVNDVTPLSSLLS